MPAFMALAALLVSAQPPAVAYVTAFRRAASSGELRALVPVAESDAALVPPSFRGVRELLERYACSSIDSVRIDVATEGHAILLDVGGPAVTRNAKRERVLIPSRWHLTLSRDG